MLIKFDSCIEFKIFITTVFWELIFKAKLISLTDDTILDTKETELCDQNGGPRALGMQSMEITDNQIIASSSYNLHSVGPQNARFVWENQLKSILEKLFSNSKTIDQNVFRFKPITFLNHKN